MPAIARGLQKQRGGSPPIDGRCHLCLCKCSYIRILNNSIQEVKVFSNKIDLFTKYADRILIEIGKIFNGTFDG